MAKPSTPFGKPKQEGSKPEPSQKDQEVAAYYNWLNRGCPGNDDQKDWFDAEQTRQKKTK